MWILLVNPLVIAMTLAAGYALCRVGGIDPHAREMWLAAIIGTVTAEIAVIPTFLSPKSTAALFRAAFVGTVLHLLSALILAVAVILVFRVGTPFVYWMLVLYWTTLIVLCTAFARVLRTPVKTIPN